MALKYNCTICNRAIGYEGVCWKCKAEKERNEALNLSEEQILERQIYLIEHLQELEKRDNPADKYFWDCLSYVSEILKLGDTGKGISHGIYFINSSVSCRISGAILARSFFRSSSLAKLFSVAMKRYVAALLTPSSMPWF